MTSMPFRVTPEAIEAEIVFEKYFTAADPAPVYVYHKAKDLTPDMLKERLGMLTFCVMVLRNGFTVTGESACAVPEVFDAGMGRGLARKEAFEKVRMLLAFRMCDERHNKENRSDVQV